MKGHNSNSYAELYLTIVNDDVKEYFEYVKGNELKPLIFDIKLSSLSSITNIDLIKKWNTLVENIIAKTYKLFKEYDIKIGILKSHKTIDAI